MTAEIRIQGLNFYYGKSHALKNINLTFEKNKITGLVGASGSGKSSLLRIINRICDNNASTRVSGEVWFNNENILSSQVNLMELRKKIGMVFQKPTPFPMTIFDNIAFALRIHEKIKGDELATRVESALRRAALWDEVKDALKKPGTRLSGGQQQRLCIARAIALKPTVLLLDEPTSALDPISSARIETFISNLAKDFTILLVTHQLKQAQRIADNMVFMHQGQVLEQSSSHDFFNHPQHDLVKEYLMYLD